MAYEDKKRRGNESEYPSKRSKSEMDPSQNPYLAHMYEEDIGSAGRLGKGGNTGSILNTFRRHQTTTKQANKAEDGPLNPFNGNELSNQYFKILKTRRNLPIHQQRWVVMILSGVLPFIVADYLIQR
jgi:pre-mRNA-splicing factor ATP-dependent RNA helicase DHX15/PRP43